MFAALGWICSGVLTRMVTLWICLNRSTVQSALWMTLHYITSALLKNNWICTKSHGHSVRPDASCDSAGVIVCPVYLCVFFVYSQVCEVCPLEFLGSTVVYTFVLDEWWGFPVYISQLCMPVIAVWAERPAGSIYKPYSHMEQLRPATRSFNRSQLTVSFSPHPCTAVCDIFHFGICGKNASRGCAAHTWCRSLRSNRSLNSSFWSAWEPHRIQVRYSWKMKYITSIPEAQIPDGTQWLEGDMAIFSSPASTAPA